jgi:hypothetical protein
MKKILASIVLILMMAGLSYAAGPPVQPIPNVKGWWAGTSIVTQTGGSAANGSPGDSGPPPFYWSPGKKMLNQLYLKVDFQWGTQIKGTYCVWIPLPGPPGSGDFFAFPFEGYVNGNLFQLYTSTENSPYNGKEQQRYLTGILTKDSEGKQVIHGMGIGSRDMPFNQEPSSHSWQNIVFTFTFKPYKGPCDSCDDFPPPGTDDQIGASGCPWQGCP